MGKYKLRRFAENEHFKHLIQPDIAEVLNQKHRLFSKWNAQFFEKEQPLVLELGCGKGEYTLGLARNFPEKNFLGIDIKGARLWRGAKTVEDEKISNAGFLRTRIEFIDSFFAPSEIDELWITFPDPQLKERRAKKRLTAPGFLNKYNQFLKPDGIIHLKTDSKELYDFTLDVIRQNKLEIIDQTENLYETHAGNPILAIQTHYEQLFRGKGKNITYLQFRLNRPAPFQWEAPDESN